MSPLDLIMHCYPILVFFLYFSRFAPVNYRISTRRNAKDLAIKYPVNRKYHFYPLLVIIFLLKW